MTILSLVLFWCMFNIITGENDITERCKKSQKYDTVYGIVKSSIAMRCSPEELQSKMTIVWKRARDDTYLLMNDLAMHGDSRMRTNTSLLGLNAGMYLIIDQLEENDESFYECLIMKSDVKLANCIRLIVLVPSEILSNDSSPSVAIANEGESLKLHCFAIGKPEPNVTWRLAQTHLKYGKEKSGSQNILQYGNTFRLDKISRQKSGSYICNASNGVNSPATRKFTVNVHYKPSIRMMNERIGQARDKPTMIRGEISGYPVEEISWHFNGRKLDVPPTSCMSVASDDGSKYCFALEDLAEGYHSWRATLWIIKLLREDFGIYSLAVNSPFGQVVKTAEVFEIKPVFNAVEFDKDNEDDMNRKKVMKQFQQNGPAQLKAVTQTTPFPRNRASYLAQQAGSAATSLKFSPFMSLLPLLCSLHRNINNKFASR